MIKRADGRWQQTITINGQKKYFYGKTKAEVLNKISNYKEDQSKGKTYHDILKAWEEEHNSQLEYSTIRSYIASIQRVDEQFGNRKTREITPAEIQAYITRFSKLGYSKKTVTRLLSVLKMSFDYAITIGEIQYNPCASIKLPKNLPHTPRALPTQDAIQVIENTDWLFPIFLMYTGCRRAEALAITYEDIDYKNKRIRINKSVGYKDNVPYLKTTKTSAGIRFVPLLDKLVTKIPKGYTGLIFPDRSGELQHNSYARRLWDAWCADNNIKITPHQLRHNYATILYDAGVQDFDAMSILGHADIQTTRNIYTHIRESRRQVVADALNAYVCQKDVKPSTNADK